MEGLREILAERITSRKTALIVVDVQNDFCHREGAFGKRIGDLSHIERSVTNLIPFLDECRRRTFPIIFVRTFHGDWTDSVSWVGRLGGMTKQIPICLAESWGAEFYRVSPLRNEFVVTKHRFSGFFGTDLDLVLRSRGIETLLLCGVATNVCVETTARDAFNLDYNVILVEDCCGPFALDEHAATLTNISKYFGIVSDSKTLTEVLKRLK